ncbi:carbonic anhydrase [Rickettsia endosymbiont of Polydrusus tereticollis]|uniref:carbonic anhydrase n=1 Tax=Rickettsia endosymbiont of Polydrusus tereticollis TaxID=3066251 RepID=UPI003133259D
MSYIKYIVLGLIILTNVNLYADSKDIISGKETLKVTVSNEHLRTLNTASTLLISCVDFRLQSETVEFMNKLNLLEDYDQVSLPGSSLALVNDQYPYWGKTIEDVIDTLQKLHNIKQVIFLDHRECGAYKLLVGAEYLATPQKETDIHTETLNKARKVINEKFPNLKVYTFLMGLDGKIEQVYDKPN